MSRRLGGRAAPAYLALLTTLLAFLLIAGGPSVRAAQASPFCDSLRADLSQGGGKNGLLVTDLGNGRELCASSAERALILASNTKLFTTAALLGRLGPDRRLQTTIWAVGRLNRNGVLRGDLYLRGAGDPALAVPAFSNRYRPNVATNLLALTVQIKAAGIKRITGRLYADDTFFDRRRGVADSGYRTSSWIGPLSGLVVNSGYAGDSAGYFATDPARIAAERLLRALRRAGVTIPRSIALRKTPAVPAGEIRTGKLDTPTPKNGNGKNDRGDDEAERRPAGGGSGGAGPSGAGTATASATARRVRERIAVVRSPTVSLLSQQINVHSDNFFAETMIKTLGALEAGRGSTAAGAGVVMRHARSLGSGAKIVDGSGLTRGNTASPRQVVRLLSGVAASPYGGEFRRSLPLSGRDGTLAGRMRGSAAERRCEAKTGTLTGVSALSGYCTTRSGREIAFSILMNSVYSSSSARYRQDRIAAKIAAL